MKLPYATLSKVLMDQIYHTYIRVKAAQSDDSDGGKKVTRSEVWDLVSNFILVTGMKMEELISLNNNMKYNVRFRWQVLHKLGGEGTSDTFDASSCLKFIGQLLEIIKESLG